MLVSVETVRAKRNRRHISRHETQKNKTRGNRQSALFEIPWRIHKSEDNERRPERKTAQKFAINIKYNQISPNVNDLINI